MSLTPKSAPGQLALPERGPAMDFRAKATAALNKHWGFKEFRSGQLEVIDQALHGRDVLLVAPTNFGKSLCYQVPAVIDWGSGRGATLVLSPLVALIRDQVRRLDAKDVPAAYFDSYQSEEDRALQVNLVKEGRAALIYVAPERLMNSKFLRGVLGYGTTGDKTAIARVVVDEGHVIPQWGRDFRFAYGTSLSNVLKRLKRPPVFACSATVTPMAREMIIDTLGLSGQFEPTLELDRPNLHYQVRKVSSDTAKKRALLADIGEIQRRNSGTAPVIVYCNKRTTTEELATYLHKKDINARCYHAGMTAEARDAVHQAVAENSIEVLTATTAFGMGIDWPHVRAVIHYDTPGSLEQYAQEAGRAGRDGKPSNCILYSQPEDIFQQLYFIRASNPSRDYIWRVYKSIWENFVTPSQKREEIPETTIRMDDFLPREGEYKRFTPLRQAALTTLIGAGILELDGWKCRFKMKPREAKDALPKALLLDEKREYALAQLAIMNAWARLDERELRSGLISHFTTNGMAARVGTRSLRDSIAIDPKKLHLVTHAVGHGDIPLQKLVAVLRGRGRSESIDRFRGAMKDLSNAEIKAAVQLAAWRNLIDLRLRGSTVCLSIRPDGIQLLSDTLSKEQQEIIRPSTNAQRLLTRMLHPSERPTIINSLSEWNDQVFQRASSKELLIEALKDFRTHTFELLGERYTGRELVAAFIGDEKPRLAQVRRFLQFFFDDPFIRASEARAQQREEAHRQ
ncbi:MAG: ATP-dependent DNA helicase RecQ [Proteobacteria bacterium]|nr:ATP-dependent DNA helicase RecQ [Pseudomonadota bacterium]